MASKSEASFANKLAKGQQILHYIQTLPAYKAPHDALSAGGLEELLKQISEANNKVASNYNALSEARAIRLELYHGKDGIKKRAAMIRDFVGILPVGKAAPAYLNIQKETQKMNSYKKPAKKEETTEKEAAPVKKVISNSETSFGSLLQGFKNISEIIKNIADYTPSNALITKSSVEKMIDEIDAANQAVNTQLYGYSDAVQKRYELYEGDNGLRATFQNIKTFIAANFGKDSTEFKEVSKLKY